MSKYNLTDILEQYKIGSGWTTDFDYDGMLKTGLGTSIDTPIEVLKKMSDDFEDVNYHRENSHLQDAIDAIEIGDMKEAEGRLDDFHVEIRKTIKDQGMDIEPTLGKFMDARMEEDKDKEPRDGVKSAAAKLGMKPKHVKEVSSRVGSRIEGLLNIPMKKKFLDAGMDLIQDLLEDDQFFIPDVIEHLSIELEKYYDGFLDQGDKLAGLDQQEFTAIDEEDAIEDEPVTEDSIEEALPKFKGVPEQLSILRALRDDGKGTKMEIQSYMDSLKRSGDEFDDVDDYVEDFKNYVADKSLQEHFGRFMKDYQ